MKWMEVFLWVVERMKVYITGGMNESMPGRIMEAFWLVEWIKVCMIFRINGSIMAGGMNLEVVFMTGRINENIMTGGMNGSIMTGGVNGSIYLTSGMNGSIMTSVTNGSISDWWNEWTYYDWSNVWN